MFKRIMLVATLSLAFTVTPNKASASIPIKEIVDLMKLGKDIYDIGKPLLVAGVKVSKKASKKIIHFIKKKHHKKDKNLYVNPLRTAAAREVSDDHFIPVSNYKRSLKRDDLERGLFE